MPVNESKPCLYLQKTFCCQIEQKINLLGGKKIPAELLSCVSPQTGPLLMLSRLGLFSGLTCKAAVTAVGMPECRGRDKRGCFRKALQPNVS